MNPDLLFSKDKEGYTPLARALSNMHTETYLYMLEQAHLHHIFNEESSVDDIVELIVNAISSKDFSRCLLVSHFSWSSLDL